MIQLKSKKDIAQIRKAGDILYHAILAIKKVIAEGITTHELNGVAHNEILRLGGTPAFLDYHGYPASICISVNEEVIHGIPGKRRLAKGDIVGIDLGVVYEKCIADAALTIPVGVIGETEQLLVRVTRECLERGIEAARAGNRVGDISEAIWTHAQANGFEVVREYCGHGVGFTLHEEPQVYNYPAPGPNHKLKEGMVLAIEPMVNMGTWKVCVLGDGWTVVTGDGSKSAHFEHTVAIFGDHTEILTHW